MTTTDRPGRPAPFRLAALLAAVGLIALLPPALAQVPSPAAITLSPPCGEPAPAVAGYTIAVTGVNFNPLTAVLVTFDAGPGGRPESVQGRTDGFGRFSLTMSPTARPEGALLVRADDFRLREATATFLVPCPPPPSPSPSPSPEESPSPSPTPPPPEFRPELRLEPPIGPPGFVTLAVGSGFPPNAPVTLAWSLGITGRPRTPLVAEGDGGFRVQVLIFHRDILGPRKLRATPAGEVAFPDTEADFLVVPGHGQPRDFRIRR